MVSYINYKRDYGIETIEAIETTDYKSYKEFKKDLHSRLKNYRLMGMNCWISSRATKDWYSNH